MLTYHRTALGAIVELDSTNGQKPDPSWTTITPAVYARDLAVLNAVRPAMQAKSEAGHAKVYAELVKLGLSPESARMLTGHNPNPKEKP